MRLPLLGVIMALTLGGAAGCGAQSPATVTGLRCEYLVGPLGIDAAHPRLRWVLQSDRRGEVQTAYQVLAASTPEVLARDKGDLWDSGKVGSDATIHVAYAGKPLASRARVWWKVRTWDGADRPSAWSRPATWSMGLLAPSEWQAQWIESSAGSDKERRPAPMLRKAFHLAGPARRATLYVSALGLYELRLNGRRVGDHVLAPEWTDYHKRIQYQTYDVTDLVRQGDNAVGACLGDGWYAGRIGLSNIVPGGPSWGHYGPRPRLLVQLEVELADGRREVIATDASWRVFSDGPIRAGDILDGETYDARREPLGWDGPGFDESVWQPARVAEAPRARLVAQPNEPIRVVRELKPVALTEPKPGVFIFDLGQNMVGWCRLQAKAAPGVTITLRHGEALNPDGTLYTANLRGAPQVDRYTFRTDGPETFEPRFTYHGFRYVEVTGLPARPPADALTGRVFHSAAPDAGRFECSSQMLTQLMRNIVWTQRANLMSTPTDCPQRDERLGWMGDIQIFSQTACFNMDMAAFFTKWLRDVRDEQAADGRFPDFAPHPFGPAERFSAAPVWADAGVIIPWRMYQNYADMRLLGEHFDAARRWVEFVRRENPGLIWRKGRANDYNDWLNGDTIVVENWPRKGGEVPKEVFATAFFAHSAELVARMAEVLGRKDDAARYAGLAGDIKAAFNREFVKPDGRITGDTQAGYALALNFDLLPDALRGAAVAHVLEGIEKYGNHLSTGIQSTQRLMMELTRAGRSDVAWRLVNTRTMPSWGYSIDQGATTVWERWDGYVGGRGFQDPGMNSLNHWAIGAVGEWMYRALLGINSDDAQPGYKHFVVRPRPGGGVTWAKGEYDSIRGRIAVAWKTDAGALALDVTVPPNTSAAVYVPAKRAEDVTESGKPAARAEGVKFLRMEDGAAVFEVVAGRYAFSAASN